MIKSATQVREEMFRDQEYVAELNKRVGWVMDGIERAKSQGRTRDCFSVCTPYQDEVKRMFIARGYTFKPTGYVGGVWQLSEDICW
jgi:hypothetical protein